VFEFPVKSQTGLPSDVNCWLRLPLRLVDIYAKNIFKTLWSTPTV
jgi:hypothetical protein